MGGEGRKIVAVNRQARHLYHLMEGVEAGLVLEGQEVKSLRAGRATLTDAFARVMNGEAYLLNATIPPYGLSPRGRPYDPKRKRKLLLHRKEIDHLAGRARERGLTLVPTELYFRHGVAKATVAVAKARRAWDKREAIKKRDEERRIRKKGYRG